VKVAQLLDNKGYHLKALWLTIAPAHASFVPALGTAAAANVLTAGQWHTNNAYTDAYFTSSPVYSTAFEAAFEHQPSYVAAGASAASYSLAVAIQEAFKDCSFLDPSLSTEDLLFNASLIQCTDAAGVCAAGSGYARVLASLAKQRLDTFFGRVRVCL